MTAGPGDEMDAADDRSRGGLRASHADRERVIGTLKTAFVQGMLAKDEFDERVSQTFASRTRAELTALTADLHIEPAAARSGQADWPRSRGEQPVLRPGPAMAVATALCGSVWAFTFLPPWPLNSEGEPPRAVLVLFLVTNLIYLCGLIMIVTQILVNCCDKYGGEQPPRRSAPGSSGR